ncbi:unnamed protein product [Symbiodinium pilosum]|uniref:Uncharacterized protein n=1 Tax=Symbiodinium pilosum TaxID=2952 RepID=A0A812XK69_SYMPI|nr:unnamed protein product [Symbiodinium pilosum]
MRLHQVLLLPLGILHDCLPIQGYKRKPYFVASWFVCGGALLAMSMRPLPPPYYCRQPNGDYDMHLPPCNPGIHAEKNWYVFPLCVLVAGVQMGVVAGEGLLLQYSKSEPVAFRGQMKAEFTIVTMAGSVTSSAVIGIFMNGKEYLGTFDWGLSFNGLMTVCLVITALMIPISLLCVYEPKRMGQPSCRTHFQSSWKLVKNRGVSSVLLFAFVNQFFASISTTAAPMVRSQWAGVKVLQQQLFLIGSTVMMMVATWIYKVCLLQTSWRKALMVAIVTVTLCDAVPTFLAVFGIVRDQYFYLGEEVVGAVPSTALALVTNLMIIELSEPGLEGLCYGLIGTLMNASQPVSTALSNQLFGLFRPSLSELQNYIADTLSFRATVAWSYVLTYVASLLGMCALPLIPRQKSDAQKWKKESRSSPILASFVLAIPSLSLPYGVTVLLLASQPQTACLRWVGGPGCQHFT